MYSYYIIPPKFFHFQTFYPGYSNYLKEMLFTSPLKDLEKIYQEEESKVPKSLTSQFSNRLSRENAILQLATTQNVKTPLFPTLEVQDQLIIAKNERSENMTQSATSTTAKKKRSPHCKKCKKPMLGHPRNRCPD